jgi:predicted alpha/beta superfamily hydrolase
MGRYAVASPRPRRANFRLVLPSAVVAMFGVCALTTCIAAEPVPAHESLRMMSSVAGEERRINVYLPPGYDADTDIRYPLLLMLDGGMGEDFPHLATSADRLIRRRVTPPFVVVGIENTERRHDMTGRTEAAKDLEVTANPGGSERFRRLLRTELLPVVRARYRLTEETAVIGESLAGLFVIETLLLEPDLFDTYIALDPSLWWNADGLIRDATARLQAIDGTPVRLLLAAGGPESNVDVVERFVEQLRQGAPASLSWRYVPRPDLRHDNIYREMEASLLTDAFAPDASSEQ